MRPRVGSLSTFRTLLCLTAFLVMVGFVSALPAAEKATTPREPTRKFAKELLVQSQRPGALVLNGDSYRVTGSTKFYSLKGQRISPLHLPIGALVNVDYLTGGSKTEDYPYFGADKVLVNVRIVPKTVK
jgi:hypothetical protein